MQLNSNKKKLAEVVSSIPFTDSQLALLLSNIEKISETRAAHFVAEFEKYFSGLPERVKKIDLAFEAFLQEEAEQKKQTKTSIREAIIRPTIYGANSEEMEAQVSALEKAIINIPAEQTAVLQKLITRADYMTLNVINNDSNKQPIQKKSKVANEITLPALLARYQHV